MRRAALLALLLLTGRAVLGQSVSPSALTTAGGTGSVGPVSIAHSFGQPFTATLQGPSSRLTQGVHQAEPLRLRLHARVYLQGPYDASSGLMSDALRAGGLLPATEPYSALGHAHPTSGGEHVLPLVLLATGSDAIVDWVRLELRPAADLTVVAAARNALVQRDGDIVDADGSSPVPFAAPPGNYHVLVRHRNHLGAMTAAPLPLASAATAFDLTDGSTATYGTEAQALLGTVRALWCGDVSDDGALKYVGLGNDRDPILVGIGGSTPTATATGYSPLDVNLDGVIKYIGSGNDRDPILVNIGGSVPTAVRHAQTPSP